jgi:hypothetical protein
MMTADCRLPTYIISMIMYLLEKKLGSLSSMIQFTKASRRPRFKGSLGQSFSTDTDTDYYYYRTLGDNITI